MTAATNPSFVIRAVRPADCAQLTELARGLDSYNLPADRAHLEHLIAVSESSFAEVSQPPPYRRYLFVAEELATGRIRGTALLIAKHGVPGTPHVYFDLVEETVSSATLKRSVTHRYLQLGWTEDGPTEVGGLVVEPAYRRHPEHLGRQLSLARFVFLGSRRAWFQPFVVAEVLPKSGPNGQIPVWEAIGRPFTGLSFAEADRLSITNKEFIVSLFPAERVYLALLPAAAQAVIGVPHEAALPAVHLLEAIGFRPLNRVEPFDGGPYYGAPTDQITLVQQTRSGHLGAPLPHATGEPSLVLTGVGVEVRAVAAAACWEGDTLRVPEPAQRALARPVGTPVHAAPLPRPRSPA